MNYKDMERGRRKHILSLRLSGKASERGRRLGGCYRGTGVQQVDQEGAGVPYHFRPGTRTPVPFAFFSLALLWALALSLFGPSTMDWLLLLSQFHFTC